MVTFSEFMTAYELNGRNPGIIKIHQSQQKVLSDSRSIPNPSIINYVKGNSMYASGSYKIPSIWNYSALHTTKETITILGVLALVHYVVWPYHGTGKHVF